MAYMTACNIYDLELNRIGSLFTWVSMVWEEGYNTMGSFQLELQATEKNMELIQTNRYVGTAESDTLMFIESVDVSDNEIIANGFPATVILDHRVSTTEISNTNAEAAMRQLISEMEPWPCVELGEEQGFTVKFTPQTSDQSVEEYCEVIAQACDLGFKFVHDKENKKLLFTVYQPPENPNAKYSTLYGNVGDVEYTQSDVKYKNVAIVAGDGEGSERVTVVAGDTSSTGADRRELYIDARDVQRDSEETEDEYKARLVARGEGKLVEQNQINTITFNIDNDVTLGETVFVNIPELNTKLKARIITVTDTSQKNGTTREISIGNPTTLTSPIAIRTMSRRL